MTLEELNEAKAAAISRDDLLKTIANVRQAGFADGFRRASDLEVPPLRAFGVSLDERTVEALRKALIVTLNSRVAAFEIRLRKLGVVFPAPAPTLRPPTSWDAEAGEFTFVIASTGPEPSERLLGYAGPIAVDQIIMPRGLVNSRRPMPVVASGGTKNAPVGEVVRIWEEGGQILGRAMLLPEASAARAAVASGAVADVGWHFNLCQERVTQREGLRPLVTVEAWNIEGVVLISDDPGLGRLDPQPPRD